MSSFDPNKLGGGGKGSGQSKPRAERLFVAVESFETPADGFHYAVGRRVDNPDEVVKVRLTTVSERVADWPDSNEAKVKEQYVTGEFHRDTIADKAKANIPLISFDEAYKVATNENGVTEYRAHWPKVMAANPQAETMMGLAHIKLRDSVEIEGGKRSNAQAYVEMLKGATIVNKDNIDAALTNALSIKDEQGRARDPIAIVRVFHEGKQVAAPRLYPDTEKTKVFDQALGDHKEVSRKVDAAATLGKLMEAKPGFSAVDTEYKDVIRAVIAGVKGDAEPNYASQDQGVRDKVRNYYYGAQQGALTVEVVAAEKIDFGADSRKTYLNEKDRSHLAAYTIREPNGDYVRETPAFTNTVVAVHRHPDGEPYAVFASPTEMWPKKAMMKLAEVPYEAIPRVEFGNEAAKTVEAEKPAPAAAAPAAAEPEERQPETAGYDDGPSM